MTVSTMIEEIRQMPREDLIQLMQAILDQMSSETMTLTEEEKAELDRRIVADDAHPEEGVPWAEVLREARARHGR